MSIDDKDGTRLAAWVDGLCKTCGAHTHSCKCAHPENRLLKELFAAPQVGEGSTAGPAKNGEPAVAATWIDTIPTHADGVTCRIDDVRRAWGENRSVPSAVCAQEWYDRDTDMNDPVVRAAILLEGAAEVGIEAHYADGSRTPNSKLCEKVAAELRSRPASARGPRDS